MLIGDLFVDFTIGSDEREAKADKMRSDPIRQTQKLRSQLPPGEDKMSEAEAKAMKLEY